MAVASDDGMWEAVLLELAQALLAYGSGGESQSWVAVIGMGSLAPGYVKVPVVVGVAVILKTPIQLLLATACPLTGKFQTTP